MLGGGSGDLTLSERRLFREWRDGDVMGRHDMGRVTWGCGDCGGVMRIRQFSYLLLWWRWIGGEE